MTHNSDITTRVEAIEAQRTNRFWTMMMAALVVISALIMLPTFASAQNESAPIPSPVEGKVPGAAAGTDSDSDLWRALRKGQPMNVSVKDPNGAIAIQSFGEDWRQFRNGPYLDFTAWGILGTIALLAVFFAVRGRIRIGHGGPSGETISRFKLIERLGHWLLASSFIILALTGLNVMFGREAIMPLIGKEAFATISIWGKLAHNYVAFSFMLALVWVAIAWIWHNIPHPRDLVWFARAGGILGGGHPAAKKFNAGQKIIFWVVILGGVSLSLSGWSLLFPFTTNNFGATFELVNSIFGTSLPTALTMLQEQQLAQVWHGAMSAFMICVIIAHIYIGSVGMEGAADAMTSGEVDRTWAAEHHSLWVEEEDRKVAKGPAAQPAE